MPRFAPAWLVLLLSAGLSRPAGADSTAFPSSESLRRLQLQTLACASANTAEACDASRHQADPLMDHPLLPAACKDTVWGILQQARPAAPNSFERRERLGRLAQDITVFCRQSVRPTVEKPATPAGGGGTGGGFGFGKPAP